MSFVLFSDVKEFVIELKHFHINHCLLVHPYRVFNGHHESVGSGQIFPLAGAHVQWLQAPTLQERQGLLVRLTQLRHKLHLCTQQQQFGIANSVKSVFFLIRDAEFDRVLSHPQ